MTTQATRRIPQGKTYEDPVGQRTDDNVASPNGIDSYRCAAIEGRPVDAVLAAGWHRPHDTELGFVSAHTRAFGPPGGRRRQHDRLLRAPHTTREGATEALPASEMDGAMHSRIVPAHEETLHCLVVKATRARKTQRAASGRRVGACNRLHRVPVGAKTLNDI